jgi:SAM-dependent methyltransferase
MKSKPAKALYNRISIKYHENRPLAISDHTELPTVMALCGDVRDKRVLDAGCGPGRHAKKLIAKGALLTGIDISSEMINISREHCHNKGEFITADLAKVRFAPASFDLVIASLSLMYLKDIKPVFKNFSKWLRPRGRLIFSIYHPVRFLHKIPDFDFSKPRKVWIHLDGCDVTVFNYYHPMENYFGALTTNGFEIRKFIEPVLHKRYKGWPEDNYRIPRSIVIEAQKR